jgi:hypothetical protein
MAAFPGYFPVIGIFPGIAGAKFPLCGTLTNRLPPT